MNPELRKLEQPITDWLGRWHRGEREAGDALVASLAPFLREAAEKALRKNPPPEGDTGATTLLHEVWAKLSPGAAKPFQNREHFMGVAVLAMRNLLIDKHRASPSPDIGKLLPPEANGLPDTAGMDIRHALQALEAAYPRQARVLLMRKLLGMSIEEIASAIGKAAVTVRRDLEFAEAFIKSRLGVG